MIRKRRQESGYGTHTSGGVIDRSPGIFENPRNNQGLVSKQTKICAQEVDQELLDN